MIFHIQKMIHTVFRYCISTKMTPTKKERSGDIRSLVIEHFFNGDSYAIRAKTMLIPRPIVQSIIKKYKQTTCILTLSGRGRKRKTTQHLFIELFNERES